MAHFKSNNQRINGVHTEAARAAEAEALRKLAIQAEAGDSNAAEILAVLAEDPDSPSVAESEGFEVPTWDGCDAVDTGSREFEHAAVAVRKLVHWRTPQMPVQTAAHDVHWHDDGRVSTAGFCGPMPEMGRFNARKMAARDAKLVKARDVAAFPFLFDDSGRRVKLDGRTWRSNMAKVRARIVA
jgi:hypothetical protein